MILAFLLLAAAPAVKPCPEPPGARSEKFDREFTSTDIKAMVEAINAQGVPDLFPRPLVTSKVKAVLSLPRMMQGRGYFHMEFTRPEDAMPEADWLALTRKAKVMTPEQVAQLQGWSWTDPISRHRYLMGGPQRMPCGDQPKQFYFTVPIELGNHGMVRGVAVFAGGNAVFFEEVW